MTALIYASMNGHTAIVQLLLEAGADKEAKSDVRGTNRKNHTHLHMWLTRWFEEAPRGLSSHCCGCSTSVHVLFLGGAHTPSTFVPLREREREPTEGCQMQRDCLFSFLAWRFHMFWNWIVTFSVSWHVIFTLKWYFVLSFQCVFGVCVLVASICLNSPTVLQDGLGLCQTTRPLGSGGSPPEMSKKYALHGWRW